MGTKMNQDMKEFELELLMAEVKEKGLVPLEMKTSAEIRNLNDKISVFKMELGAAKNKLDRIRNLKFKTSKVHPSEKLLNKLLHKEYEVEK